MSSFLQLFHVSGAYGGVLMQQGWQFSEKPLFLACPFMPPGLLYTRKALWPRTCSCNMCQHHAAHQSVSLGSCMSAAPQTMLHSQARWEDSI